MIDSVRLRLLTSADASQCRRLELDSFPRPWSLETIANELTRDDAILVGAVAGAALIGFASLRIGVDEAELHRISVQRTWRAKGVGRDLLREGCAHVWRRGGRSVFLEVASRNARALRLYETAGFGVVGRRRGYYPEPPDDAVVMRRTLP